MNRKKLTVWLLECLIGAATAFLVVYLLMASMDAPQFVYGKY